MRGSHGRILQHQVTDLHFAPSTVRKWQLWTLCPPLGHRAEDLSLPTTHPNRPSPLPFPGFQGDTGTDPQPSLNPGSTDPTPILGNGQSFPLLPASPDIEGQDALCASTIICSMGRAAFLRQIFVEFFGAETAEALIYALRISTCRQQEHAWRALQE